MTTLGDAQATLDDLDADLSRYDTSEDGNLRKLSAFSRAALYLHNSTPLPEERAQVDESLHRLVRKHGLPAECVEGHWTKRKPSDS